MTDTTKSARKSWTKVAFGDVVQLARERSSDPEADGHERFIGLEHIDPGDLRVRRWGNIADGVTFTNVFKPGQVLFGKRRAYQRKVAVADFGGVCSSDIYVLEPKGEDLLPELLPFICQTDAFFEHAVGTSAGSLSPRTNWDSLASFEFTLPPIEEQRRCALALAASRRLSEGVDEAIVAAERLLRSACISFGTRLLSDESVPLTSIEECGEIRLGRQRSPEYQTGRFPAPYLRVANVYDGFITTDDILEMDFDERDFAHYSLQPGDILLNEGQSRELVGRSAIFRGQVPRCCFQNTLIRFRSSKLLPEFSQTFFRFMLYSGVFASLSRQTSSIAHLGLARFRSAPIRVPGQQEQLRRIQHIMDLERGLISLRNRRLAHAESGRTLLLSVLGEGDER
jgi:type I restriction enzyme S subunit